MKRGTLIIIIIVNMILSVSCINRPNRETKDIKQKEKAPETLVKVMEGIEGVLVSVDNITKTTQLTEAEFQIQRSKEEDKKKTSDQKTEGNPQSSQDNNQDKSEKKEEKKDEKKDNITRDEEIFMKWREIDDNLKEIHKDWNSYEVASIKNGASPDQAKEFKKSLNSFTKAVENRQIIDIMDTGSITINFLAPFFDLYKDEINGDLSRISYSIYQAFLKAKEGDIKTADKLMNEAEEYSRRIRQRLDKNKDKDRIKALDKLSLAISDMKLALNDNSIKLLEIKRDIALKNIKALRE